jgi:transcriptional regulator with XRE-family HTH domain
MSFGEKIKQLRKEKGWSQDKLGEMVKMHGRHIGKYESGQVFPTAEAIIKLAKIFNVSTDFLLLDDANLNDSLLPNFKDRKLLKEFEDVDKMNEDDKKIIITLIDAFIKKNQLIELLNK